MCNDIKKIENFEFILNVDEFVYYEENDDSGNKEINEIKL